MYIYIYIPYYLVPATPQFQCLMAIQRDSGLSTLCHSCSFASQPAEGTPWLSPLQG